MEPTPSPNLLVIEADPATAQAILQSLQKHFRPPRLRHCASLNAALAMDLEAIDLVLIDTHLPDASGLEVLDSLLARRPDLPIVILTSVGDFDTALQAIRRGAYDYVIKTGEYLFSLPIIVEKALANWRTRQENLHLQLQLTHALQELQTKNRQLEEAVQQLQTMAATDPLTGLANRRAFTQSLEQCFAQCTRYNHDLSCVMIDVDGFKQYNDTLGHQKGDLLLQKLGRIISANCRRSDVAGRYGGDEFVLLLPQTDITTARLVARRISDEFAHAVRLQTPEYPQPLQLSLSMGLSSLRTGNPASPEQLVAQADHALYRAKSSGKACMMAYAPTDSPTPLQPAPAAGILSR